MFSATVRFNLDPFGVHSDAAIWEALDMVDMSKVIQSLPGKLLEAVAEGGENFSTGQRQLICIARVLLRKPKILIMDEATASVDNSTDDLVQVMVRERFKDATVFTIAHRLHTVMDSDQIVVLDNGSLAEMDSPSNLIEQDGVFAGMWKQHQISRGAEL